MNRKWPVLAIVVVLLGIIAERLIWPPRAHSRIGVILSISGKNDFIGKPEEQVLKALQGDEERANDQRVHEAVELEIEDSQGDPKKAVQIFHTLADDPRVLAIIGPSTSGESIGVADAADKLDAIPVLSLAASRQIVRDENSQKTRRWVFKFAQNDSLAAQKLLVEMVRARKRRIALLYSNDGFGMSGAAAFREAVQNDQSLTIRVDTAFSSALDEPEPIVASLPPDIDGILIWGTAPGPSLLVQAIRRQNKSQQIYLSHGNASEDFIASTGAACENAIVVGSRLLLTTTRFADDDLSAKAVRSYIKVWNDHHLDGSPSHFGGHARDAFEMLSGCIFHGARTRDDIRQCLENTANFAGVTGTFTFTPNDHAGLGLDAFGVYRIEHGRFLPVDQP